MHGVKGFIYFIACSRPRAQVSSASTCSASFLSFECTIRHNHLLCKLLNFEAKKKQTSAVRYVSIRIFRVEQKFIPVLGWRGGGGTKNCGSKGKYTRRRQGRRRFAFLVFYARAARRHVGRKLLAS